MLYRVIYVLMLTVFVKGEDMEQLKQEYLQMIIDCSNSPMSMSDIEQLQKKEMPDKESIKCLFACAYKKSGMMTEDGFLSIEGLNQISQKYLANDPELMKKADDFAEACKYVNDESVSDGEKGCERAALIFKCSVEKGEEFGF